jgi:type IV secretion system protein VirD4
MSMQRSRRARFNSGTPTVRESTSAVVLLVACLAALAPLVVQAMVARVVAGAFAWPSGQLGAAYGGLMSGIFGAGLPQPIVAVLPPDAVLWGLTATADLLIVAVAALGVVWVRDEVGEGGRHGLATRSQSRQALGVPRLRAGAAVIRPDLHSARRAVSPGLRASSPGADRGLPPGAAVTRTNRHPQPHQIGWRLGRAGRRGPELWVPFDRTTCVVGPQGSGKTLDLLVPALMGTPGAALVTLTKPEDLFLTLHARQAGARPVAVLDPFNAAPGTPEFVWDPISGCEDAMLAERRAKAFANGTIKGATSQSSDRAARFYAGECAKVLQAYFHGAAIAGIGLDEVLTWVASPRDHSRAEEILRTHPSAEPLWDGLLRGALFGDERTAGNTITTVQQAMALFFQRAIRERCIPSPGRPSTDIKALIQAGGTIYLLGRDDPYASASPLMTAVTEDVLDAAKSLGQTSPYGRLCPPFLACLDELPSTAPVPTLATRMANERALGLSFIIAAQTWRQFVVCYGEDEARTVYGLSNNVVVFGGGKDIHFYRELSDLIGSTNHTDVRYSARGDRVFGIMDRSYDQRRVPILEPAELRRLAPRTALVLADAYDPIIANLTRCIDGPHGQELLTSQRAARRAAAQSRGTRQNATEEGVATRGTAQHHPAPRVTTPPNTSPADLHGHPVSSVQAESIATTRQRLGMPT